MENLVMMKQAVNAQFWNGKKVFVTGHTGFKGGWLSLWLASMGAKVTGYGLSPNTNPNLYNVLDIPSVIEKSYIADIRDFIGLQKAMLDSDPEIIIHMAAQPLVRYSYQNPVETYAVNVMGTVHLLEAARHLHSARATVVVTTDKCYENKEWVWGYRENDQLGGFDPYSNSKGCAELVASAYRQSYFFNQNNTHHVATARAGNVIGGGDWSEDRLIPDAIKAFEGNSALRIRNPRATRPWQHVLEPLSGYLILLQHLYEADGSYASAWNFGPADADNRAVQEVVELVISKWNSPAEWQLEKSEHLHEANFLKLDCSKANRNLGWHPRWNLELAIEKLVQWHYACLQGENMREFSLSQINQYVSE